MTLVISSGRYKGRRLKTPSVNSTRPSSNKCRAAVFNICQGKIENACFLDLYAGSGAMGIEALSRNASFSIFIESNRQAIACIKENIADIDIIEKTQLIPIDIKFGLKKISQKCDIVYIDPPYKYYEKVGFVGELLQALHTLNKLKASCLLFFEASSSFKVPLIESFLQNYFKIEKIRKYGSSQLIEIKYL